MAAASKPSAIMVVRDRKTTALPPMQLGSFHKLFEPDEYEGKKKFKARLHINPVAMADLEKLLQTKCIEAHFAEMKKQVDAVIATAAELKKTPPIAICEDITGCESPKEWLEGKLKNPHEKDKVQLPTIMLHVDYFQPLRKGETEKEPRSIKFWNAQGDLIGTSDKPGAVKRMTAGSWVKPVVHTNLFLSKQLGKAPRCQLMLVGLQIIKLVNFGAGTVEDQAGVSDEEMRKIMGEDYDHADDLHNVIGAGSGELDAGDDDDESPF